MRHTKKILTTALFGGLPLLLLGSTPVSQRAQRPVEPSADHLASAAHGAVDPSDLKRRDVSRTTLRNAGYAGLRALERAHPRVTAELRAVPAEPGASFTPEQSLLRDAYTQVAGQRDAHASLLFWHQDLQSARAEARATGKPILSLRMLGALTHELSCANSRLFRVLLYPDPRVQELLRERFVLHWSSERAVPQVTIDLGDGRVLKETLTGNSIHYVLDADARVLDAIPGLWAPGAFAARLGESLDAWRRFGAAPASWRAHHRARTRPSPLSLGLSSLGARPASPDARPASPDARPPARNALPVAATKAVMEVPLIKDRGARITPPTDPARDPAVLARASERLDDIVLSDNARALLVRKLPHRSADTATLLREVERGVRERLAVDTVINQDMLQSRLHAMLAQPGASDFTSFNARVYTSVFLTPRSDPWLGLRGRDTFLALDQGGVVPAR